MTTRTGPRTGPPQSGTGPRGQGARRPGGRPRYFPRRKVCTFCVDHVKYIDYKNVAKFGRLVSQRYKIEARRKTGTCAKHQRGLATAIKRARYLALIPFSPDHRGSFAAFAR